MKKSDLIFGLIKIPLDFLAAFLAFQLGYLIRVKEVFHLKIPLNQDVLPTLTEYRNLSFLFAALLIFIFALASRYRIENQRKLLRDLKKSQGPFFIWVLSIMAYFFVVHEVFFSRLALGISVIITALFLLSHRSLIALFKNLLLKTGIGQERVLIIGKNEISKRLIKALKADPHYNVVGQLTVPRNLKKAAEKHQPHALIQTSQEFSHMEDHDILEFCQENHLEYHFVPDILEVERSNIEIENIGSLPLIHLKPTSLDGWGKVLKRSFDIVVSSLLLIILSPLFLLTAIAIKLDSKGPVLFTKLDDGSPATRIGKFGQPFKFYKFRSMKDKTHMQRYNELAKKDIRQSDPLVKIKNDPRITRVGHFIRRWDIDELPQLWNVLRGDMSLVGPRPHLPEEVEKYQKHHKFLLTIKPGITGLSQTSGRSDLDFEEEVRLDTYYIKHWSLTMDLRLLIKTIGVVIKGHSAE